MGRATIVALLLSGWFPTRAAQPEPLIVESTIALGDIRGRIDHLAIDSARQRLYVAELGNNSVGVIDLRSHQLLHPNTGLNEPQGIAYVPSTDTLYVANGGDGSLRLYQGTELHPSGSIALGADADNVRFDPTKNRLYVGYGNGALAILDPQTRNKVGDIPLTAHPESFQLATASTRIYINLPNAHQIAVADCVRNRPSARWSTPGLEANFPMALDEAHQRLWVVFRRPATLASFGMNDGALIERIETCGDADDVFVDRKRERVYVSCGEGFVDTFESHAGTLARTGRVATASGARTALYVPELDRLYVAARATATMPAAIWILRPAS
jgi:DNA-binding beta-propeller fold protein YncE